MFCPASSTCARKTLPYPPLTVPFSVYRQTKTPRARCLPVALVPHPYLDLFLIRISPLRMAASFLSLRFQKGSTPLRVVTHDNLHWTSSESAPSRCLTEGRWVSPFPEPTCLLDRLSDCILTITLHRHGHPSPALPAFLCRLCHNV
jgi:hypothetical protein